MSYKTDHAIGVVRYYLHPKQLSKLFLQPRKIPTAIVSLIKKIKPIFYDVKLKKLPIDAKLVIAEKSITALATLAKANGESLRTFTIEELFSSDLADDKDSQLLGSLFTQYGSDKASVHNYHLVYASVLKPKRETPMNILEIGLGTNNIDVMSNMGLDGKPGASLRAFRDMYKKAQIFGADIDERVLFTEERIRTFFVDQTKQETLENLRKDLSQFQFDLVIDDGLHNSHANLNTLNFALSLLKKDGTLVIEDIRLEDKVYYQIAATLFSQKYELRFVQTRIGYIVLIKRT
jgi:SAM-dependent methyltransferase